MTEKKTNSPRHIAVIMDGNGRWAVQRGLSRLEGHRAGLKAVQDTARHLNHLGLEYATFYAFSTENWTRPPTEVKGLFKLLGESIDNEKRALHEDNIRIKWLGQEDRLASRLIKDIREAEEYTRNNTGMTLCLALNYGGRQEIVNAARALVTDGIKTKDINEKQLESRLYTSGIPDVDLLIRTAGEQRLSNFLLWQCAYAEFYFTPILWPDFNRAEMDKALHAYASRQRRFGGL
ncbi:MAG: isoprenyl transferase [Dehalococcoidia bacterium]|nr:isoprenyl transferase [Dehalococcoidia bacterium]